ncbi:TAF6-like RNA polymerase II p300/CBP-associated factor-associated factor 65 kDa subunit 6L [Ixodes scapularis]
MQSDATKVHGAMLLAAELIILQRHKELPRSEAGLASYAQLYECFGDALATRLPTLQVSHLMYTARREPAGTSSPTGEQLLEAFYEDEHSMSADEDNNSEDSGLSGPPPGALHPQVKSTISDPARGIRLTIALRRPTADPPKAKRKRTPDPREPPFEVVPLVLPRKRGHVVICFEGATPLLPRAKEEPVVPVPECRMAQLSRRMGRVGRSRRRKVAPFRSRHLGAGIDSLL